MIGEFFDGGGEVFVFAFEALELVFEEGEIFLQAGDVGWCGGPLGGGSPVELVHARASEVALIAGIRPRAGERGGEHQDEEQGDRTHRAGERMRERYFLPRFRKSNTPFFSGLAGAAVCVPGPGGAASPRN